MLRLRVSAGGGGQHCAVAADSCVRQGSADADRWRGGGMTSHVFHCRIKPLLSVAFCFRSHWKIPQIQNPPIRLYQSLTLCKKSHFTTFHSVICVCSGSQTLSAEKFLYSFSLSGSSFHRHTHVAVEVLLLIQTCKGPREHYFWQEAKTGFTRWVINYMKLPLWSPEWKSQVWETIPVIGVFSFPSPCRQADSTGHLFSTATKTEPCIAWSLSDLSNTSSLSSGQRHRQTTRPHTSVWHLALQR